MIWLNALLAVYPLAVYIGLHYLPPSALVLGLAALLSVRSVMAWRKGRFRVMPVIMIGLVVLAAGLLYVGEAAQTRTLRFYPVAMNLTVSTTFLASLFWGTPIVERLARLQHPDLPPQAIPYTRRVTAVWSAALLTNTGISAWTAVYADMALWALYNGMLSYLLLASVFGIELLVRRRKRAIWEAEE